MDEQNPFQQSYLGSIGVGYPGDLPENKVITYAWNDMITIYGLTLADHKKVRNALATILSTKIGKEFYNRIRREKRKIYLYLGCRKPVGEAMQQLPSESDGIGPGKVKAYFNDPEKRGNELWINPNYVPISPTVKGPQRTPLDIQIEHELGHVVTGINDDGPDYMQNVRANEKPYRAQRVAQLTAAGVPQWVIDLYAERNAY